MKPYSEINQSKDLGQYKEKGFGEEKRGFDSEEFGPLLQI
jgi:hypothetical protein